VNIHIGNLSREVTEAELRQVFEAYGQVTSVRIVRDRTNGVSKGFGFIEMPDRSEGRAAIEGLHMKELAERRLDLTEARPAGRGGRPRGGGGRFGGSRRRRN